MTHYAIGKAAGVSHGLPGELWQILRFMAGERDLWLETVDKLAVPLGLLLCQTSSASERPKNGVKAVALAAQARE